VGLEREGKKREVLDGLMEGELFVGGKKSEGLSRYNLAGRSFQVFPRGEKKEKDFRPRI